MPTSLDAVLKGLQQLSDGASVDRTKYQQAAKQAKLALVQHNVLSVDLSGNSSQADLKTARSILELLALLAVRHQDIPNFTGSLSQLQSFWTTSPSTHSLRPQLTGLHLLLLLSRNEIGNFHTQLERLEDDEDSRLLEDAYVAYPIQLEKWLMEGSFSKVWQARSKPPMPEYKLFLDDLMRTVRNEIASCAEKAYTSLPMQDAATLLFFTEMKDLMQFAANRPTWQISPTTQIVTFVNPVSTASQRPQIPETMATGSTPSESSLALERERVISAAVSYAKELVAII